jgi:hypothetical protein
MSLEVDGAYTVNLCDKVLGYSSNNLKPYPGTKFLQKIPARNPPTIRAKTSGKNYLDSTVIRSSSHFRFLCFDIENCLWRQYV